MKLLVGLIVLTVTATTNGMGQSFSRWSEMCDGVPHTAGIAIGDLDGDGDLDLVFANGRHLPEKDLVFSNDGWGTFSAKREIGDRADPSYGAALGDLDGDGDLDLVVANDVGAPSFVYLNDGHGNFAILNEAPAMQALIATLLSKPVHRANGLFTAVAFGSGAHPTIKS